MRSILVAAIIVISSTADADEAADRIKAMNAVFTATTSKLSDSDEWAASFKKTLAADGLVSWDASNRPQKDPNGWSVGRADKVQVLGSKAGWAGTFGWIVAELKINYTWSAEGMPRKAVGTFHYLAVFVPDGKDVKAKLVHLAQTHADTKLTPYNYVQTLPKAASPSALVGALAQPKQLASQLSADPTTSIVGTSDRDHAFGAAAAKKLLASWSKLELDALDTHDEKKPGDDPALEVTVGDATLVWTLLRMKLKGKWYPISGLAVFKKSGDKYELVALEYDSEE